MIFRAYNAETHSFGFQAVHSRCWNWPEGWGVFYSYNGIHLWSSQYRWAGLTYRSRLSWSNLL